MKWTQRGHQYDEMYENITRMKSFYLFGAGDYGRQFLQIFRDEILIDGYVDNNKENRELISKDYHGILWNMS